MRKGGVIVMSFGNLVNGSAMPSYIHEAFLDAFRKLPDIQVYWRIGSVRLPDMEPDDIPPNVNLTQFVPQNDLLGRILFTLIYVMLFFKKKVLTRFSWWQRPTFNQPRWNKQYYGSSLLWRAYSWNTVIWSKL